VPKKILKKIIHLYISIYKNILLAHFIILTLFSKKLRELIVDETSLILNSLKKNVIHINSKNKIKISIFTPNKICFFRANTFSSKEPETLLWIEEFGNKGSILFDIGANIGLYSIYHALLNGGVSYAFEPSFFNLRQLTKNINENNCENKIIVVSNPLSSTNNIQEFKYSCIEEGGALSSFGVNFGFDGNDIRSCAANSVMGFSLDYLFSSKLIKDSPDFIKIDVDGIEHLILVGAIKTISSNKCKSILIETNSDFKEQEKKVHKILIDCGFKLREKHTPYSNFEESRFKNSGNEIWTKI